MTPSREIKYTRGIAGSRVYSESTLPSGSRHPTLLQRPIGVKGKKAVVGRPVENLLDISVSIDPPTGSRWQRVAPHLRAALIATHLLAIGLMVLPCPPNTGQGMHKAAWQRPTMQRELGLWADRLSTTPEQLEGALWGAGKSWAGLRRELVRPTRLYSRLAGVRQPAVEHVCAALAARGGAQLQAPRGTRRYVYSI